MTLARAIALSSGNKAKNYNGNDDAIIVVQERYSDISKQWLRVWIIREAGVQETDIPLPHIMVLHDAYGVDPDSDYWIVV